MYNNQVAGYNHILVISGFWKIDGKNFQKKQYLLKK